MSLQIATNTADSDAVLYIHNASEMDTARRRRLALWLHARADMFARDGDEWPDGFCAILPKPEES